MPILKHNMLRKVILVLVFVGLPAGIWFAIRYGIPETVTFSGAVQKATTSQEGDMAPKIVVTAVITSLEPLLARDEAGEEFALEFTGKQPDGGLRQGTSYRFVGHVHGGSPPTFHATQVYDA